MNEPEAPPRAAVLTVGDRAAAGTIEDTAGSAVVALLRAAGFDAADPDVLPDDPEAVAAWLRRQCDAGGAALAVSCGML